MDDLHKALGDITAVREQMARATVFRGYGPLTMVVTGGLAITAATIQQFALPSPVVHLRPYLVLWMVTAFLCAAFSGVQMYTRARRMHSALSQEMIQQAVEQFMPAVGAGALVSVVLVSRVPNAALMLPGLWQIIFSLGIFASVRFLPKAMTVAAGWYLLCGLVCLSFGDARALSPWAMGVPFGAGQLIVGAILRLTGACDAER
jgi:hypothetical protein